jgi:hypothetical protein
MNISALGFHRIFTDRRGSFNGGGGIRTHEPLRDGIAYFHLESSAFDRASLPLLDKARAYLPIFQGYVLHQSLFMYLSIRDANQSLECDSRFVMINGECAGIGPAFF